MRAVFGAVGVMLLWSAAAWSANSQLRVLAPGGRVAGTVTLERQKTDPDEYMAANELADALSLKRSWNAATRTLALLVGDRRVQATVDSRTILDGETQITLGNPVLFRRGSVMLPLEFLERVVVPRLGPTAKFDRKSRELRMGSNDLDVLGVDGAATASGAAIRVRLARARDIKAETTSPQMLRVQILDARIDPVGLATDRPAPLVKRLRAEQRGRDAVLYFELDGPLAGFTSRKEDEGRTAVLELQRGAAASVPQVTARQPVLRDLVNATSDTDSFDVVVLDPGHGGFDHGAKGEGVVEKDITLQLAQAIQPVLEHELGVRVVVVRGGDETLAVESRAEVANRCGADVFISLHCNAWYDTSARGIEVDYAPLEHSTTADVVLASARRGVTDFTPWSSAHVPYVERSHRLADLVAAALGASLDGPSRGARAAELEVLEGAAMPGILVEVGFLTNPDDARRLVDPDFAPQLATGLVTALRQFRSEPASGPDSTTAGGAR